MGGSAGTRIPCKDTRPQPQRCSSSPCQPREHLLGSLSSKGSQPGHCPAHMLSLPHVPLPKTPSLGEDAAPSSGETALSFCQRQGEGCPGTSHFSMIRDSRVPNPRMLSSSLSWDAGLTGMGIHPCRDHSPGHSYCCRRGREQTMSPNWAQTHPAFILGEWEASWRIPQKLQHGPGSPGSNPSQRQTRVLRGMVRVPRAASAGSAFRNLHI